MSRGGEEPRTRAAFTAFAVVCGLSVAAAWIESFTYFRSIPKSVTAWLLGLEGSMGFWLGLPAGLALAAAEALAPRALLERVARGAARRATGVGLAWALTPWLLRDLQRLYSFGEYIVLAIFLALVFAARWLPPVGRWPAAGLTAAGALLVHVLPIPELGDTRSETPALPAEFSGPVPAADAPCLLLVVIDTLRDDRVGAVRDGKPVTPFLDRLGVEGHRVSIASTSNQTGPAHASLLTGTSVLRNGVVGNGMVVPESIPTFAELLGLAGWRTGAVTSNPIIRSEGGYGRGFECYGDVARIESPLSMAFFGVSRRSSRFAFLLRRPSLARHWLAMAESRAYITPDALQPRADDAVRRCRPLLGEMAASGRPWFLFAHFMDPHAAYEPPEQTRGTWATKEDLEQRMVPSHSIHLIIKDELEARARQGDPDALEHGAAFLRLYDEEILFADAQIENLVTEARRASGERPLWIVVTSDHGEHFLEYGLLGHSNSLYEELVRLPLVVHGIDGLVRDEVPLRLEDLSRLLIGRMVNEKAAALLAEGSPALDPGVSVQIWGRNASVRTERWKLLLAGDKFRGEYEPLALWDLQAPAGESTDVAASHPEVVAELSAAFRAAVAGSEAAPMPESDGELSPRMQLRLAELGYTDH